MKSTIIGIAVLVMSSIAFAQADMIYTQAGSRADEMYLSNADLTNPVLLHSSERRGYLRDPDLHPAGGQVAFIDTRELKLLSYSTNGGGRVSVDSVVTLDSGNAVYPDFSPDGSKILYSVITQSPVRQIRIRSTSGALLFQYDVPNSAENFAWLGNNKFFYALWDGQNRDSDSVNGTVMQLHIVELNPNFQLLSDTEVLDTRNAEFGDIRSVEYSVTRDALLMTATSKISQGGQDHLFEVDLNSGSYTKLVAGQRAELSADESKAIYREYVQNGRKSGYVVKVLDLVSGAIEQLTARSSAHEYFAW